MKKYLDKVKYLVSLFLSFDVLQVPRIENAMTDALSKLAASLLLISRREHFSRY